MDTITALLWVAAIPCGFILAACLLAVLFGEEI